MGRLYFEETAQEEKLEANAPIQEACEAQGIPFACTEGICGTCVIAVPVEDEVHLSPPTEAEQDFFGAMPSIVTDSQGRRCSERLACQCRLQDGLVHIQLPGM